MATAAPAAVGTARRASAHLRATRRGRAGQVRALSVPSEARGGAAESVAGLMAAAALFVSLGGLVHRPARVIPAAILVALVAAAIGGRHQRLAALALAVAALCFVAGMTIAVATERPLY